MHLSFNLTAILYLFGTLVIAFLFHRFYSIERRKPSRFGFLFSRLVFWSGIGMAIYSFFFLFFPQNISYLRIGNIIGEPFLIIGFTYGFAVFFLLARPTTSSYFIIIPLALVGVFLSIFFHFLFPPFPLIDENGILHWNAQLPSALNYSIFSFLGIFPLAIAFFREARKNKEDKILKRRSIFLGIGTIFVLIGGIILSFATTKIIYALALLIQNFGFIFFFISTLFD
jgi:hypothetical protein